VKAQEKVRKQVIGHIDKAYFKISSDLGSQEQ